MADFNHDFIGWLIAIVSIFSILILVVFIWKFSSRSGDNGKAESMGHVWDENLHELNNPLPGWWKNLFYITLIWGFAYLIMYPGLGAYPGLLNWSQQSQYEQEIETAETEYGPIFNKFLSQDLKIVAADPEALEIGQRLFSTYCTTCHGSDARGARGYPNLRDNDWLYGGDVEQIKVSIMNGRVGNMPPWEEVLGYENVFNVTAYVQQLAGHEVDTQVAFKGKAIYEQNCAVCHGLEGGGNIQLGAPNLTDDIWLYGGSQKRIIESIAKGRIGNMPPHKEFLGEAKAHLLSAYVYSLGRSQSTP